jgi:hypothetical protein
MILRIHGIDFMTIKQNQNKSRLTHSKNSMGIDEKNSRGIDEKKSRLID